MGVFIDGNHMESAAQIIVDVIRNVKSVPKVYWEADLKAFNSVQNPAMVRSQKRIVYSEEKQIQEGLQRMRAGQMMKCDILYVHISLWSSKDVFKRLIMAHLMRFD